MIWVASAILFVVVIFCVKNKNLFKNTISYISGNQQSGLTYGNETVADLVNKSTTGDGIPDWKKILFGLDPTKTENVPGVPDSVTIAKLEQEQEQEAGGQANVEGSSSSLTQTDQFSREFLATLTTLTQTGAIDANGNMDQATADQITNTLENNVQNSPQKKIYSLSDLKISNDNGTKSIKKYSDALDVFFPKTYVKPSVMDVLQQFAPDDTGNNVDPTVLPELSPTIKVLSTMLNGMLKTEVPQSLAVAHLSVINSLEEVIENLNDIQQYNNDPLVSFSGISKYETNTVVLGTSINTLANAIDVGLKD
ncbi:MAG: hypothetical protein P4L63_02790 [Candidatus Pacebacteria bacterium]|nr:hypothetical protein [Candidatus Paceibacterota bacterium]